MPMPPRSCVAPLLLLLPPYGPRPAAAYPVLVTTDGDTALHALRDVHLAPEGAHGVLVGAEAGADARITFLGGATVGVADGSGTGPDADGARLTLVPGAGRGRGTPGSLDVRTPRRTAASGADAQGTVRVLRIEEAQAHLDGALVADAEADVAGRAHELCATDNRAHEAPAALTLSHRLVAGAAAPGAGVGVGVAFAAPLQGSDRKLPPTIVRINAALPLATSASAESTLATALRASDGALDTALTVSHAGTTAAGAVVVARPSTHAAVAGAVPYLELQAQVAGGPSAYLFAGTNGRVRTKVGAAPAGPADGSEVLFGARRRRSLLEDDEEGETEAAPSGSAAEAPSSAPVPTTAAPVVPPECSVAADDAAAARAAADAAARELRELRRGHAELTTTLERLRTAFCAVSPHDDVLCGGGL